MRHHFILMVNCDNAVFTGDDETPTEASAAPELARILREVATRLEDGDTYGGYRTVFDVNGNDVGRFALKNTQQL